MGDTTDTYTEIMSRLLKTISIAETDIRESMQGNLIVINFNYNFCTMLSAASLKEHLIKFRDDPEWLKFCLDFYILCTLNDDDSVQKDIEKVLNIFSSTTEASNDKIYTDDIKAIFKNKNVMHTKFDYLQELFENSTELRGLLLMKYCVDLDSIIITKEEGH